MRILSKKNETKIVWIYSDLDWYALLVTYRPYGNSTPLKYSLFGQAPIVHHLNLWTNLQSGEGICAVVCQSKLLTMPVP